MTEQLSRSGPSCLFSLNKRGENIKSKLYSRVFFSILFLLVLLIAFYIAKPFLPALVTGALIAYLSYPLYRKTQNYIKNKSWAAFLVTIFILLIFTVPTILIMSLVFKEAQFYTAYLETNGNHLGSNFLKVVCRNDDWALCKASKSVLSILPKSDPDYYIGVVVQRILNYIIEHFENFISSLLSVIFDFFIMIFIIYYLYKDGYAIYRRVKQILPFKESHKERILKKFHEITTAVFYGNISAAAIQGILGSLGFLVLGVPSPFLWGMVMGLFAFVPYIGTAIIWLPASLDLMSIGYINNNNLYIIHGILLFLYGLLVLSVIDHFLKPKLIGDKAEVHPILVLIGILGGLKLFGIIGLILGPVMLAIVITFADIYSEEDIGS